MVLEFREADDLRLYCAGSKFPANFTRDSMISGILMQDAGLLHDQLEFCRRIQGKKQDPKTGEEPGKIHHEFPGFVKESGLSTQYNACDAVAWYLIGHHYYEVFSKDSSLKTAHKDNIRAALDYINLHIKGGLFTEDPAFSGAGEYALRITYWKDSDLAFRERVSYPVTYFLVQCQYIMALRVSGRQDLADILLKGLHRLFSDGFPVAVDKQGRIKASCSDFLQGLFYLEKGDLTAEELAWILRVSGKIESAMGYMSLEKGIKVNDPYHAANVWPFEQALIHSAASRWCLGHEKEVASRILPILRELKSSPELIIPDSMPKDFWWQETDKNSEFITVLGKRYRTAGCDMQLWTIAAKKYFSELN